MPEAKADPIIGFKAPILFPSHCVHASTPSPVRQEIGSDVFDEEQIHALRACSFASIVPPLSCSNVAKLASISVFCLPCGAFVNLVALEYGRYRAGARESQPFTFFRRSTALRLTLSGGG
jgi:hypothetical protein